MSTSARSNAGSPSASDEEGDRATHVSHQSEKVTFPQSAKTTVPHSPVSNFSDTATQGNPFKMPSDNDIFMLRDKERQRKKQLREKQKSMKVHEKMTYASKVNYKTHAMIHPVDSDEEPAAQEKEADHSLVVKEDPQFVIAVTRDRHVEKESLAEYIGKKREMFLVQYSLGVKRDEMRKLEDIARAEERKLEFAEQYLEEDAAMFDEFLRENDKNSVDAIQIAEQETKAKFDKVLEIKRITTQMMGIKSEISKYEETLKEYQMYKKFLDDVTPKEVKEERRKIKEQKLEEKRKKKEAEARNRGNTSAKGDKGGAKLQLPKGAARKKSLKPDTSPLGFNTLLTIKRRLSSITDRQRRRSSQPGGGTGGGTADDAASSATVDDEEESEDEPDLWFTDPQQLLDIFAELEEQNLSLIQNSQETEEALEETRNNIKDTKARMEKETVILKEQIDKLTSAIHKEEEKAADLEMKAKMFSFGEFKQEDQDRMLAELNRKVEDVYRNCIGQNEANISTLQMLTNIENRLEELFEQIEMMPQDKVEAAEKAKEKERRLKAREEKMEQQRLHQEERVRRALERAKAEPKKKTGKKLVFRSEPPQIQKKDDSGADKASREEEELAYFFT